MEKLRWVKMHEMESNAKEERLEQKLKGNRNTPSVVMATRRYNILHNIGRENLRRAVCKFGKGL